MVWSNVNALYTILGGPFHVHSTTFDPELTHAFQFFFQSWGVHSTTFDPELRNERFTLISFMGFPAKLNTLQPFQICICNRTNSKQTFSNGPQLMGKRFMANLHASLDSTCKSRISKFSTKCQNWGVHSTTFDPELRNGFKFFSNPGGSIQQLLILNSHMHLKFFPILGGQFHNF